MNDFDKNLRKKLYDAEMPVSEGMWSFIESQIPVKKEKPKIWLLFLLIAFTTPFIIFQFTKKSKQGKAETTVASIEHQNEATSNSTLFNENTSTAQKESNNYTYDKRENSLDSKLTGINSQSNKVLLKNDNKIDLQNFSSKNQPTNSENLNLSGNRLVQNDLFSQKDLQTRPLNLASKINKKLKFVNKPIISQPNSFAGGSSLSLIEKTRVYKSSAVLNKLGPIRNGGLKFGVRVNENKRSNCFAERMESEKLSVALCPSFNLPYNGIYGFLELLPGVAIQNLDSKYSDNTKELSNRKQTEFARVSLSASIGIGKQWKSGFILETGLNYDRINIRFDASSVADIYGHKTQVITIDTINTPLGMEIKYDTSYRENIYGKDLNSFSQINIPIAMGYSLPLQDRYHLVVKAGILMNINSRNSGTILNEAGEFIQYSSKELGHSLFKTNLGLSYFTSFNLEAELNSTISAYGGIRANIYPESFSMSSYAIRQTYTKYGFNLGLKYKI